MTRATREGRRASSFRRAIAALAGSPQRPLRGRSFAGSLAAALLVSGCAASSPGTGTRGAPPATSSSASRDSTMVLEVRLRRSAELADTRGALRVFDSDLEVQYRLGGRGPGLDAGEVTFDSRVMRREVDGKGAVRYRLGRDATGTTEARDDPWSTIACGGGPGQPAAAARVKLAPIPIVTRPGPRESLVRSDDFLLVMMPPVPEVWYRATLDGAGDPVTALDVGEGRWVFPRADLARLSTGRARILIEVETSCARCPGPAGLRIESSARSELEIPVTLL